jgi:hypothetical protein
MSRVRWPAAIMMATAVALAVGSCGVSPERSPRTIGRPIQFGLDETSTTTTTTTTTTVPVTVPTSTVPPTPPPTTGPVEIVKIYYVKAPGRLVPVARVVPRGTDLSHILTLMQTDPTPAEQAAGLRTAVKRGTVLGVKIAGGTATVDVNVNFQEQVPVPSEQELEAAQITMTLTERGPGIGRVRFTMGGTPIPVPRGDGSTPIAADHSVSRDDYMNIVVKP